MGARRLTATYHNRMNKNLNKDGTITQLVNIGKRNAQHMGHSGAMRRDSTDQEGDQKNAGGRGTKGKTHPSGKNPRGESHKAK